MTNSTNLWFLLHPLLRGWGYALVHRQTHLSHNSFQAGTWSEAHHYHYLNEQHHRSVEARTWSKGRVQDQHTLCTHCREPPEQVSVLLDVTCWMDFTKSLPKLFFVKNLFQQHFSRVIEKKNIEHLFAPFKKQRSDI